MIFKPMLYRPNGATRNIVEPEILFRARAIEEGARKRVFSLTEARFFLDMIDKNPSTYRVRVYSFGGFIADEPSGMPPQITYCEGKRRPDNLWSLEVMRGSAVRSRGQESPLAVLDPGDGGEK